jgi:hypothetical protein
MSHRSSQLRLILSEALAEEFKDKVADNCGDERYCKVCVREDVMDGEEDSLTPAVSRSEFAHEEIGIEEEDNEGDLDDRVSQGVRSSRPNLLFLHAPSYPLIAK